MRKALFLLPSFAVLLSGCGPSEDTSETVAPAKAQSQAPTKARAGLSKDKHKETYDRLRRAGDTYERAGGEFLYDEESGIYYSRAGGLPHVLATFEIDFTLRRAYDTKTENSEAYEQGEFFFTGRRSYKAIIRDFDLTQLGQPWPRQELEALRAKGKESCGPSLRYTVDPEVYENSLDGETRSNSVTVSDNVTLTKQTSGTPSILNLRKVETSCFGPGLQMELTWQEEYTGTEVMQMTNKTTGQTQSFTENIKSQILTSDDNNKQTLYPHLSDDWASAQNLLDDEAWKFGVLKEHSDKINAGRVPLEDAFGNVTQADKNSVTVTYIGPATIGVPKPFIKENEMELTLTVTKD